MLGADHQVREALAAWDLGKMLSRVRRLASLRQEDMAQMTGLSQSALSMLENGTRPLTHIDKITRLLDGLAVPPELVRLPLARCLRRTSRRGRRWLRCPNAGGDPALRVGEPTRSRQEDEHHHHLEY
ncbi:helix-turn-helix transcriptional regulator [Streptomyces sp. MS1.AVA.3]|uniref:helix-turn-helix domain-containing protein n=1 Tax=Streptomyces decoyicus TaxID=249567 RepID=UPI0030BC925C